MDNNNNNNFNNDERIDNGFSNYPVNENDTQSNDVKQLESGTTYYYSESYKKPKVKKNSGLLQLILVSIISSIIGGGIVFASFQFVVPAINSSSTFQFPKSIFERNIPSQESSANQSGGEYKKVVIESADSPVVAIAEKVGPSIVGIRVTAKVQDWLFGVREGRGEGSGIIIGENGYIITNNHVIETAMADRTNKMVDGAKIEVILPQDRNKAYTAQIVGRDSKTDLAVLKIDTTGLPAVEFGDSDTLKVGELAVAIGNPAGLEFMGSVTAGIISGLNRRIVTEGGQEFTLIQTDAAINQGNSGGALVNSKGQVVGINTIKIGAQGFEGLGFAIPINSAKEIANNLIEHKYVKGRPFLGISIEQRYNEQVAKQNNLPTGLLVYDVVPLSGAYKAGIQRNDIITKFDGKPVKSFQELEEIKNTRKPGDTVQVEVYRDGETKIFNVELTEDKGN